MSNYSIEGGLNFYEELLKDDNTDYENVCLISGEPITFNSIRLGCGHTFNYDSLFKDVVSQKQHNRYGVTERPRLSLGQFKCPYCRTIVHKLLPYTPIKGFTAHIPGVNSPAYLCMNYKKCSYEISKGKNKGNVCNKPAFDSEVGIMCPIHYNVMGKKLTASCATTNAEASCATNAESSCATNAESYCATWTHEMQELCQTSTIDILKKALKERGLKTSGSKKDLVFRIITSNQQNNATH
jgi:hypothetical protein